MSAESTTCCHPGASLFTHSTCIRYYDSVQERGPSPSIASFRNGASGNSQSKCLCHQLGKMDWKMRRDMYPRCACYSEIAHAFEHSESSWLLITRYSSNPKNPPGPVHLIEASTTMGYLDL